MTDLRSVEGSLKRLGVAEPVDASSIQTCLEKLPEDGETFNSIKALATRLPELRTRSEEAKRLLLEHKRDDLEKIKNANEKILLETIEQKQRQADLEQDRKKIEVLEEKLSEAKNAFVNSEIPMGDSHSKMKDLENQINALKNKDVS